MTDFLMTIPLLSCLGVSALLLVWLDDLLSVAMLFGIYSLLLALLFVVMDAPDVALTETVIGAGIASVLLLASVAATGRMARKRAGQPWLALAIVSSTGLALLYSIGELPRYGDAVAPPHGPVAQRYIESSPQEIGIDNMVTSILGSYRGHDTLGEVGVVLCAAIAVLILFGGEVGTSNASAQSRKFRRARIEKALVSLAAQQILRVVVKIMIPLILLFALYVQFHGEISAGGGFQAGALVAAGFILYALVFGLHRALSMASMQRLQHLSAAGLLLFIGTGILAQLRGGNFLEYSALLNNAVTGQHLGIWLIELGIGITVTAVMLILFYAFANRILR